MTQHAVTLDDLRSLVSPDAEDHIGVRCRRCDHRISFFRDDVDPQMSKLRCGNSYWKCGMSWTWQQVAPQDSQTLNHWFYVIPPAVGDVFQLALIENEGKVAFHRLVPVDDSSPIVKKALEALRARARKMEAP